MQRRSFAPFYFHIIINSKFMAVLIDWHLIGKIRIAPLNATS